MRAEPDGYTLLIYHVGLSTAATLYRKLPYDTRPSVHRRSVSLTDAPMTIIARNDYEPNTLKELVDYLKKPGVKASMGNAGVGSASHLCGMLFLSETKVQVTTVPYRGTGPVMNDLVGKQIDLSCDQATNTTGPILGKQVKGYAVTTKVRLKSLPDLPTADEAGLKGFELGVWHGLFAPKGLAARHRRGLSTALRTALKDPDLVKRFNDINTDPMPDAKATPEAANRTLLSEIDRWAPIIKASGQYAD